MFDFQKLDVYQKAKFFNLTIQKLLMESKFNRTVNDQLRRAAFSIMLNIAESSSRFSLKDRRNFLIIARGSAFECVAIFEFLSESNQIGKDRYSNIYLELETISKMLYGLIKKLN